MNDRAQQRYRALIEVMAVLARTHRIPDVVNAVHAQSGKLFAAPVTLFALRAPDGGWECQSLEDGEVFTSALPARPDGLLERAMRGQLTLVDDAAAYSEAHGFGVRRLREDSRPVSRAWMGAPLEVNGQALGVLSLQSYTPGAFTPDDYTFLHALAQHVSIAMENAHLRERLESIARTDDLTGLGNRRAFREAATKAIARSRRGALPVSLAILDVQDFKQVNDTYGHATGDAVLADLAQVLSSALREDDDAYRLGGDEFAVLLWGDEEQARIAMSRVGVMVRAGTWPDGVRDVRVNVGIAPWNGHTLEEWTVAADSRMYDAKSRGLLLSEPTR